MTSQSSKKEENGYMFKRDYRSMTRLNYNHWLFTQLTGYLLHPSIPSPLLGSPKTTDSPLRVADIGTGTGIYLLSLAPQLPPSAQLDGFDISSEQFPPEAWRPRNFHLYTHDVFEPFPNECQGVYDIVHVRYFMTLVQKENLETLTRNLVELLKPGGHIQWSENDMTTVRPSRPDALASSPFTDKLVALMKEQGPRTDIEWVPHLSSHLKSPPYNLSVIADDRVSVTDPWRMCFNLGHLIGYEDVTAAHRSQVVGFGGGEDGERGKRMQEMLDGLNEELIGKGTTVDQEFVVVVAQKPLG